MATIVFTTKHLNVVVETSERHFMHDVQTDANNKILNLPLNRADKHD